MIIVSFIGVLIAALMIGSLFFHAHRYRWSPWSTKPRPLIFLALQVENKSYPMLEIGVMGRHLAIFPRSWIL